AGDGLAIATLRDLWFGSTRANQHYGVLDASILAVELEKQRFKAAYDRLSFWDTSRYRRWDTVVEADAFHLGFKPFDGASVLYLNPPYDTDKIHGRLEQGFLARLTQCLAPGDGLLIFLVPHYALEASASFLACNFSNHRALRLPDPDFASFKQCVLLARRRASVLPDNDVDRTRIVRWATSPESMPVLEE